MKLAIKVLTEWDRINVIYFFEKHYPNCNNVFIKWHISDVLIGDIWFIKSDGTLFGYEAHEVDLIKKLYDYTFSQGVPKDMELPKVEENRVGYWQTTKTREQELEELLEDLRRYTQTLCDIIDNCPCDPDITTEQINAWNNHHALVKEFGHEKIKQLLNK